MNTSRNVSPHCGARHMPWTLLLVTILAAAGCENPTHVELLGCENVEVGGRLTLLARIPSLGASAVDTFATYRWTASSEDGGSGTFNNLESHQVTFTATAEGTVTVTVVAEVTDDEGDVAIFTDGCAFTVLPSGGPCVVTSTPGDGEEIVVGQALTLSFTTTPADLTVGGAAVSASDPSVTVDSNTLALVDGQTASIELSWSADGQTCTHTLTLTPVASDCKLSPTTFTDLTMSDADWTAEIVEERSRGTYSFTVEQAVDDTTGFASTYRRTTLLVDPAGSADNYGVIWVAHRKNDATWDPAVDGAVCRLELRLAGTDQWQPDAAREAIFSMMVIQGDAIYWTDRFRVNSQSWESAFGLTDQDLTLFAGTGPDVPDFSAAGAPLQFGFLTGASTSNANGSENIYGSRDWEVAVHTYK